MTLMDGRKDPVGQIVDALRAHVHMWGVIDLDLGKAVIKATCMRCGTYDQFDTPQEAKLFRDNHRGANGRCPHEGDVKY